ncbi:MAG: FliM/FliN family flagellar motor switch protein [Phycisphaeraceae bacterium]
MSDRVESTEAQAAQPVADAPGESPVQVPPAPSIVAAKAWPWRALVRPAALLGAAGIVDGASVAAMDVIVAAALRTLNRTLGRPVAIDAIQTGGGIAKPSKGFGVVLRFKEPAIEALITLDRQAIRALATALTLESEGIAAPASPGPHAEPGAVERGLIEYLTLVLFDGVLKEVHPAARPPKIAAFCDEGQINVWLTKRKARGFGLNLSLLGEAGTISVHVHGWSDEQWAAMQAALPALATAPLDPTTIDVRLALPAVSLQPEEFDAMEAGDVILLGGPHLIGMPQACELVTDTHWSLGPARVTHDTPTYLALRWSPGEDSAPGIRMASMQSTREVPVVQMLVGRAIVPIEQIASAGEGIELNLSKDAIAPVDIMVGVTRIARGEFVIIGSELGVRVLPEDGVMPTAEPDKTHETHDQQVEAEPPQEAQ